MSIDSSKNCSVKKYIQITRVAIVVTALLGASAVSSYAIPGLGSAARRGVQEAIEYTAKKFGINLADEGGKLFAREAAEFIGQYGDEGIRALKGAGPDIIQLARRYGKDPVKICAMHSADAAGYLARNMDQALPVWKQFGKEGTDLMVRHPGLAYPLLNEFGKKGLQIGMNLSTRDLNRFLVLVSKAAGKKEKVALLDKIIKEGDKVIQFLWGHRWKLAAGATLYTLLKEYDSGIVTTEKDPDGKIVKRTQTPNYIQYFITSTWDKTLNKYPWLPLVIIALIVVWMWPLFDFILRLPNMIGALYRRLKSMFQSRQSNSREEEKGNMVEGLP